MTTQFMGGSTSTRLSEAQPTRTLFLMRHAEAAKSAGPDVDRPLSASGRAQAEAAGFLLRSHHIDVVYCSGATRARETLAGMLDGGTTITRVTYCEDLYLASTRHIVTMVGDLSPAANTALLIAHDPGVTAAARWLCPPEEDTEFLEDGFACAGIATLVYGGPWEQSLRRMTIVNYQVGAA